MKKNEKKTVLAKALTSVADGMLSKAANSRCALKEIQEKQINEKSSKVVDRLCYQKEHG